MPSELAQAAGDPGEVPVQVLIVDNAATLIAEAQNRKERNRDPTAHAEILALPGCQASFYNFHMLMISPVMST